MKSFRSTCLCLVVAALSSAYCGSIRAADIGPDNTALEFGWKDSFRWSSADGKISLTPVGLAQPMFVTHVDSSLEPAYEGTGFVLRRLAVGFDARFYGRVRACFVANLARGNLSMWDYFADVILVPDWLIVRAGRFRPWLARQRLIAGHMYQLPELSVAMTDVLEIGDGRDLGAGLFGVMFGHLEYGMGIWNGEQNFSLDSPGAVGEERVPANTDFEVGGRLAFHPFKVLAAVEEPDFSASPEPRLSLGAGAMYNRRHGLALPLDPQDPEAVTAYRDQVLKMGAEAAFKLSGFSAVAELFARRAALVEESDAVVEAAFAAAGRGDWAVGAYGQVGYFALPRLLEISARMDYADKSLNHAGYGLYPAAGLSCFLFGYHLRAQLMYRLGLRPNQIDGTGSSLPPIHDVFFMLQAAI